MELLTTLLRVESQDTLLQIVKEILIRKYKQENVIATSNYAYAAGDIPIMLVAHLDTVAERAPQNLYLKEQEGFKIIYSDGILGADDRAGIYAILKILQTNLRPSVLFTTDEEIGGYGAIHFVHEVKEPIKPVHYMIEIDRKGQNQSVFYDNFGPLFEEYINNFGFNTNKGLFSDISIICRAWKIAGVNISAGYYFEHTANEFLIFDYLKNTINKVIEMLQQQDIPIFKYKRPDYIVTRTCAICGKSNLYVDMHYRKKKWLCSECINPNIDIKNKKEEEK